MAAGFLGMENKFRIFNFTDQDFVPKTRGWQLRPE